jgi:cysteinyl-tRNA synthetase
MTKAPNKNTLQAKASSRKTSDLDGSHLDCLNQSPPVSKSPACVALQEGVSLVLYNFATKEKQVFVPIDPNKVRLYVCGPTVYDKIHLGNGRAFIVFDVLYRVLKKHYKEKVTYIRNLTDVDDKIMDAAQRKNCSIQELTTEMTGIFQQDMKDLHNLPPTKEPKATEHIQDMIDMIFTLIEKGFAYVEKGHVFFDVRHDKDYGSLSGMDIEEMKAGARVEVNTLKGSPLDFVLWKPSNPGEVSWESPWGAGRPGWHTECAAMSHFYLGTPFDVHGGGKDLSFPHHENERAQSCCALDQPSMANYWIYNEMLLVEHQKMSKSLGNFLTIQDALKENMGEVVRWALLSAHYRQPLDFCQKTLEQSKQKIHQLYEILGWIEIFIKNIFQSQDPVSQHLRTIYRDVALLDLTGSCTVQDILEKSSKVNWDETQNSFNLHENPLSHGTLPIKTFPVKDPTPNPTPTLKALPLIFHENFSLDSKIWKLLNEDLNTPGALMALYHLGQKTLDLLEKKGSPRRNIVYPLDQELDQVCQDKNLHFKDSVLFKDQNGEKLFETLKTIQLFYNTGRFLGFLESSFQEWWDHQEKKREKKGSHFSKEEIIGIIQDRMKARKNKDFHRADTLRQALKAQNIEIEDHPDGSTSWIDQVGSTSWFESPMT